MDSTGIVSKVCDESAFVKLSRVSACGGDCKSCLGCASGEIIIELPNDIRAQEGDLVRVVSEKKSLLKAVLYAYIMPLILFIISYLSIFSYFSNNERINSELVALAGAFALMIISYCIRLLLAKRLWSAEKFKLQLKKY